MRIGLLTEIYRPYVSGVVNFVASYKRALEKLGHEPYVFAPGDGEDDEERVIRSPALPVPRHQGLYLGLDLSPEAKRILRSMDVVHAHHPFVAGQVALRCRRRYNTPVVFTSHTRYELLAHYLPVIPEVLTQAMVGAYLPWFMNKCDLVIAPTTRAYRALRENEVHTWVEVVPNGIDLDMLDQSRVEVSRKDLGVTESVPLTIYTGRMSKEKSIDFLLEAYSVALRELPDLCLLLLGAGPELDRLRERARELGIQRRVRFMGEVPYENVPAYLRLADLFVTPSEGEVHSLSLIEAFAAGLPVVGLRVSGVEDIVEDGVNGRLADGTIEGFAGAMISLLIDQETRLRMSREARRTGRGYSIMNTARKMISHYGRLLNARRTSSL